MPALPEDQQALYIAGGRHGRALLSDEKWTELVQLSGLPDIARREVAILICIYRDQATYPRDLAPRATADQLKLLARDVARLMDGLNRLYDNGVALGRITGVNGWELVRLDAFFEELKALHK